VNAGCAVTGVATVTACDRVRVSGETSIGTVVVGVSGGGDTLSTTSRRPEAVYAA
jgi:hypothetical protein